ncbi:MAG: hypothetical protein NTW86_22700, partial [Candidatus Sumerlaeota bacterium]|nr:hypothetical protein [Candidatus Sumerlaeota bacterium]
MRIVCAPTAAAEVDLAAREALRLAREEGYRFGEIGFVARDLAPYHDLIRAALARLRIPFFLDRPREAACHPLTEFLAAAAQVVAGGWRTSDVVQALKTDLLPLSRDDADRLENRALALGLDGADWRNPARWEEELAAWENATAPLRAFDDACRKTETGGVRAEAFVEALHALLDAIGAGETIERWATDAEAAGAWEAAAEHRQTAQAIQSLLDEWAEGLRGALLSLRECADLLAEGLDSIRLRLVPPSLDQLLVGAIERSRHPELRAVFVLGLNDRVFPREPADDPILGEADRRALTEDGLELGPSATERLLREPFLAYIAFTRPSERLILSYVAAEPSGRKMAPSVFLDRVRAILPDVEIEAFVGEGQGAVERICDATSLGGETAAALGEALARGADPPAPWPALVDLGRERDGADRAFSRRIAGALYRNRASLDAEWAARLYETLGAISPSRLESQ